MYYLRTMAASAPIQFTVDQEQLKVEDTNVARANAAYKKRAVGAAGSAYSAVPRTNGSDAVATPATASPSLESPRTLVEPTATVIVPTASNGANSEEAAEGETEGKSEEDIFSDKVLQCSIENKDACIMCQG
jgi:ribonucleoside-diphosphate reductase subunit M1